MVYFATLMKEAFDFQVLPSSISLIHSEPALAVKTCWKSA